MTLHGVKTERSYRYGVPEREYDRLRQLARDEHSKRQKISSQSQQAYQSGDGGRAHAERDESLHVREHGPGS